MERKFKEALLHRRSYYALSNKSLVSDEEIENIVKFAVKNIPSAFNSQSTRMVLLLGVQHVKLWNIVKDTLQKIVPAEAFKTTENKLDKSFASGYGTVLFFEEPAFRQLSLNGLLWATSGSPAILSLICAQASGKAS